MPLLRVPHKLARAEAVTRADIFDTPCERLISQARVVACLVSLLALHLGLTQLPQNATATNFVLAFYSLFSAGLIGLTCQRFINPVAVWLIHFTDIAIVCLVLLLTDEPTSPFFVLFIFVLLAATLRWKWQAVIATAAAPALLLLVASVINGAMSGAVSSNLHTAIIRGAYLITIAGMLAYIGALRERSREQFSRLRIRARSN